MAARRRPRHLPRSAIRFGVLGLAAVLALATVAACSAGPDRESVSAAAVAFVAAVEHGDGKAACSLLTSDAQQAVTGATDVPCAKAVLSVKERGRAVSGTEVWGDAAQVRVGGDVLFLRRIEHRWRVSGAGCVRPPKGPYDCTIGG